MPKTQTNHLIASIIATVALVLITGYDTTFSVASRSLQDAIIIVVFASTVYLIWFAASNRMYGWVCAYGAIALLFNPFYDPLYRRTDVLEYISSGSAVVIIISVIILWPTLNRLETRREGTSHD